MPTTVERLPDCKATLRVEVPPAAVEAEREKITREISRRAKLPGFRPGKAPSHVVAKKFGHHIESELFDRLINSECRRGIKENHLDVLQIEDVEDAAIHDDGSFTFVAKLTTAPDFTLPNYSGIPVRIPRIEIADEDIDKAIESLRQRFADFHDIDDRPLQMGDIAVLDYFGTIDGSEVGDVIPQAAAYIAQSLDYWMPMAEDSFLQGFCAGLVGASQGAQRNVTVTLPDDFAIPDAAGKQIDYSVTVKAIKKQELPPIDDILAAKISPGKSLAELRDQVADDLRHEADNRADRTKIDQIVAFLNNQVDFDLPPELVTRETQSRVNDIVERGQRAGLDDDSILNQEQQILDAAAQQARSNVKTSFILHQIAEAENITVTDLELSQRIHALAQRYRTPVKKFAKDLNENRQLPRIRESMIVGKVLEFLKDKASIEEVEPEQAGPPAA